MDFELAIDQVDDPIFGDAGGGVNTNFGLLIQIQCQ